MQHHADQRERVDGTADSGAEPAPESAPPAVGQAPVSDPAPELTPESRSTGADAPTVGGDRPAPERSGRPDPAAGPDHAGSQVAFQERWQEIQLRFVDDPSDAASQAEQLVAEVVNTISAMLSARKDEIDAWSRADQPDTEQLRQAIQRYRELLDQLVSTAETHRTGSMSTL